MVAGMVILHGLTNVDLHSPGPTWLPPSLSGQSAKSGGQHRALLLCHSWDGQLAIWWQVDDYIEQLPSWKDSILFLLV